MTGRDPAAWGIEPGYHDVAGVWHEAPPEAVGAALDAMGADTEVPGARRGSDDVWVVPAGRPIHVDGRWQASLEDGTALDAHDVLPPPLPLGYHDLVRAGDGRRVRLIVVPEACHLPELRTWGFAAQLYAARSRASWGIGDLADLRRLGEWSSSQGAGMVLLNPLGAALPGVPQQPSPYFPSSRCFRNPLYIRVEEVPGAAGEPAVERAAAAGRALNDGGLIDRDEVWRLKIGALESVWASHGGRPPGFDEFQAFRAATPALDGYAVFCALTEAHGAAWQSWPEDLRVPGGAAVRGFAARNADRVAFHAWLQWLVDRQLASAAGATGLVQDLAIGADPAGADAWLWQHALALGVRVGAPPDEFNTRGQDWGFPPLDPWRLRTERFEPFVQVVRSSMAHAAGLRIDHAAGLFRLFWIPPGMSAEHGVYVRYPWEEMLGIVALESVRAGAWVVGEDLGTVEPVVRSELARRRVLSTKLLWFEPVRPPEYPQLSFAAVTTHDLPTIAGVWSGSDLKEQQELELHPNVERAEGMRRRLVDWLGIDPDAPATEAIAAAHRLLGRSDAAVLVATLDDAMAVEARPNMPGTTEDHRPNWSIPLPRPLETLVTDPLAADIAGSLRR